MSNCDVAVVVIMANICIATCLWSQILDVYCMPNEYRKIKIKSSK